MRGDKGSSAGQPPSVSAPPAVDECSRSAPIVRPPSQDVLSPFSFEHVLERLLRRVVREELLAQQRASFSSPQEARGSDELEPLDDVAAFVRMHPNTLRKAIKCGALAARRIGTRYRLRRQDVTAWLATGGRTKPLAVADSDDVARKVEAALAKRSR